MSRRTVTGVVALVLILLVAGVYFWKCTPTKTALPLVTLKSSAPAVVCPPCVCECCEKKVVVYPPAKKKVVHKAHKPAPVVLQERIVPVLPARSPFPPTAPEPPAVAIDQMCPNGWTLIANAWSLKTFPEDLRDKAEELIAAAGSRSGYRGDDVSRTIGGVLRKEVRVRATVNADIRVLYRNPKTLAVVKDLGFLYINLGTGSFQFQDDPRQYIVETIWPASFVSPTVSMGERRLWIFPDEWARFCSPNMHGIVR